MTIAGGESAASAGGQAQASDRTLLSDWKALRADTDIQFAPLEVPAVREPPAWWEAFLEWLGALLEPIGRALAAAARTVGMSGQVLTWAVVALGALLALFLLWRSLRPVFRLRAARPLPPVSWVPEAPEAHALLEQADRLAAEGRYDEATHLLLRRSVEQIAAARPGLLEPSTTAREIAALPLLSITARAAFATMAERVERSVFALRSLNADDWRAARAAYRAFALAAPPAAPA